MITAYNGSCCRAAMKLLHSFEPVLSFFANGSFAFRILQVLGRGRFYAPYVIRKKLVLNFEPLFLLSKLAKSCGNFLRGWCGFVFWIHNLHCLWRLMDVRRFSSGS